MGFKWVIGHLNRYRALGGLPVGCLQVDCRQRSFHLAAISINGHPGSIKNVFSLSCHGSLNQSTIIFPPHKQSSINLFYQKEQPSGKPPRLALAECSRPDPWLTFPGLLKLPSRGALTSLNSFWYCGAAVQGAWAAGGDSIMKNGCPRLLLSRNSRDRFNWSTGTQEQQSISCFSA